MPDTPLTVDMLIGQLAKKASSTQETVSTSCSPEHPSQDLDPVFMQLHQTGKVAPVPGLHLESFGD